LRRIPSRATSRSLCLCVGRAWALDGRPVMLLRVHPRTRNARWHRRLIIWAVLVDRVVVGRRTTVDGRPNHVPFAWATRQMTAYLGGRDGSSCPLLDGRRPSVSEAVRVVAPRFEELPLTLFPRREVGLALADEPSLKGSTRNTYPPPCPSRRHS
jgi:hypothetical protein